MRHTALLMGESTDSFLKVLALFEKLRVIDSIEAWQLSRTARDLAAHDYETDYDASAEHFNTLHNLSGNLYAIAYRLLATCRATLNIEPQDQDFAPEFDAITLPCCQSGG
ncbi:MAG: hypothetical protein K6346_04995 [Halothiobacillaceae bacterium]